MSTTAASSDQADPEDRPPPSRRPTHDLRPRERPARPSSAPSPRGSPSCSRRARARGTRSGRRRARRPRRARGRQPSQRTHAHAESREDHDDEEPEGDDASVGELLQGNAVGLKHGLRHSDGTACVRSRRCRLPPPGALWAKTSHASPHQQSRLPTSSELSRLGSFTTAAQSRLDTASAALTDAPPRPRRRGERPQ